MLFFTQQYCLKYNFKGYSSILLDEYSVPSLIIPLLLGILNVFSVVF